MKESKALIILTIFFSILFLGLVGGCITCGYYADVKPLLGEYVKPLMYISVGEGVITLGFIATIIYKAIKDKQQ